MLAKVKQWFGIEGVKVTLLLPETLSAREGVLAGQLRFQSMHPQTVTRVHVALYEKYSRGRGQEKRIDEYLLGETIWTGNLDVPANEPIEMDFSLHFDLLRSEFDTFGERNLLFQGIANAAKALHAVHSEYRVEASASVKGTALDPFDIKYLQMR